ncbi:MAG: GumC family protein [Pseudomonadota bacterium]
MYDVDPPPQFEQPQTSASARPTPVGAAMATVDAPTSATPSPLAALWRRKLLIGLAALLGAAAAIFIGELIPPRYTAEAQILIDPSELRVVEGGLRNASQVNDALIAEVETQSRVLLSNTVLRRVIKDLNLSEDREFTEKIPLNPVDYLRTALRSVGVLPQPDTGEVNAELAVLRALQKRTWASRQERTFVVDLGAWTSDRQKSVRIVNAIVAAFLAEQTEASSTAARTASYALGARLQGLQKRVIEAERAAEKFKRDNNILAATGQPLSEQQVTAVANQLIQARTRRTEAEARFNQLRRIRQSGGDLGTIPEAVASQTLTALRSRLAAALQRQAELGAGLLPAHPVMVQVAGEVNRLKREVNSETGRIAAAVREDLQRARQTETSLTTTLEGLKAQLTAINAKRVQLRELERDVQANRSVYEAFLVRTQEIAEQEEITIPNTRLISPAEPPEFKSLPPSKPILALAGLAFGTLAGIALTLFFSMFWSKLASTHKSGPTNNQPLSEATSQPSSDGDQALSALTSTSQTSAAPVAARATNAHDAGAPQEKTQTEQFLTASADLAPSNNDASATNDGPSVTRRTSKKRASKMANADKTVDRPLASSDVTASPKDANQTAQRIDVARPPAWL